MKTDYMALFRQKRDEMLAHFDAMIEIWRKLRKQFSEVK